MLLRFKINIFKNEDKIVIIKGKLKIQMSKLISEGVKI